MSTLAGNYRELSEYQKADSVFGILLRKIDDPQENLPLDFKIENILALGKSKQIQGNYDTALYFINKASQLIEEDILEKDKADIFNHYASVFKDLSKFDSAAFYQKKAIQILEAKILLKVRLHSQFITIIKEIYLGICLSMILLLLHLNIQLV